MASPAVMSSVLQALPPRPPTPPRETIHEIELGTQQLTISSSLQPGTSSLHTPPSAISPGSGSSTARRKRVGFSAEAQYQEPPVYQDGETKRVPTPVSLPSSVSKPAKSILKITCGPSPLRPTTTSLEPTEPNIHLGVMLDSTIQQLAGADRDSRLDAYMMLIRALKASNNLPDRVALQEKMSLFMQFMQRDITAKSSAGPVDSPLVNQALGLLITFLHFPAIASTLSNDFGVFIVDHCIRSFEDPSVPKEVVRHLMQVIAVQNFSTMKVMTSDRVGRLVAALRKIEEHIKGKSIIMARVHIYTKLIKQCRQLMVIHSDWLLDLFTDMLSELRDIRIHAINLGLEAGFTIGREKAISRRVMELFNQTYDETKYIEFYQERLHSMAKGKVDSAAVPQIWSVIALFFRCRMDKWDLFSSWLQIIQRCFNSSDLRTKMEANLAWSRLGYVLLMEERPSPKTVPTLCQPFMAQLKRKAITGKLVDEYRETVIGGICHLLYYTFKPNANLTLLDGQWDSCVNPLLAQLLGPAAVTYDGTYHATVILAGLFDCVTPRVWNPERAMEKSMIQVDELPAIDSKWLRRNAARVFQLVEPILLKNFSSLRDASSPAYKLWRSLVTAVAAAASKEIKVSLDTAVFVAHAFSTMQKIWKQGPQQGAETGPGFLKAIQTYLSVMIESLGLLPFTEKLLAMDSECHFVPIGTPTHRPGKTRGLTKSPLKHLFSILSALPHSIQDDENFSKFFITVFSPFLAAKSDRGRMDLAQDLMSTIPLEAMIPYGPWVFTADVVSSWLATGRNSLKSTGSGADTPVGHEYRDIVRILDRGLRSTPNLPWNYWQSLFHTLISHVRDETGEAGVAIVVIEPLAKVVLDLCSVGESVIVSPLMVKCTKELIAVAAQPRDRQALDAARRRLWGSGSRSASFDPFDNLYKAVNLVLQHLYLHGADNEERVATLLKEVGNFLERCNAQLVAKSLLALQDGLVYWIRDERAASHRQPAEVVDTIKSTWQKVRNILAEYERSQQLQLDSLQPILCAAFESKHGQIVNSALDLWNSIFENVEEVQYPEKLKAVLLSLRPFADIVLPGLELASIESTGREPSFVETQEDDLVLPQLEPPKSSAKSTPQPPRSRHSKSPSVRLSVPSKRHLEGTPEARPSKTQRRNATPKLRHDDSQIQFAAIESSPILSLEPESQVLTDRQREVRERQKEVANLFPEIRSSPGRKVRLPSRNSSPAPTPPKLPDMRAATPEPRRMVDDFIASTPTPRRGQFAALPDLDSDMAEPPSSPPEPRRNPLAKEIQSRSATNSLMDEWQFSSSPVSGSPVPVHHAPPLVQSSQVELDEFELSGPGGCEVESDVQGDTHDRPEPELGESVVMESIVEDSAMVVESQSAVETEPSVVDVTGPDIKAPEPVHAQVVEPAITGTEDPSTPRHHRALAHQDEPEPASQVSVDAPTTSRPSSRRRSQRTHKPSSRATPRKEHADKAADQSFNVSDIDERSLIRLVVELDAGRVNSEEYECRQLTESPEKNRTQQPMAAQQTIATPERNRSQAPSKETLDCIVVQSPFKGGQDDAPVYGVESIGEEQDVMSSQASSQGRQKRKRGRPAVQKAAKKHKSLRKTKTERSSQEQNTPASSVDVRELDDLAEAEGEGALPLLDPRIGSLVSAAHQDEYDRGSSDVELEVQSQIAQETEAHISQEVVSEPELPVVVEQREVEPLNETQDKEIDRVDASTEMHTVTKRVEDQGQEDNMETGETTAAVGVVQKEVTAAEEPRIEEAAAMDAVAGETEEPETSQETPFQKLMGFFKGGLEALRTAALSRHEVYQFEGVFMDVRRELIEAENRGRAPPSS